MRTEPQEPTYYIIIAVKTEHAPVTTGPQIIRTLLEHKSWLVSQTMPFQRAFKPGDRLLFYAAGRGARHFLADAVVARPVSPATPQDLAVATGLNLMGEFVGRLPLSSIREWEHAVPLKPLVPELGFIRDKRNYGLWFRLGAARVPADDFQRILAAARLAEPE